MPTYRPRRPIAGRMSPLFAREQLAEQERSFAEAREAARLRDEATGRQGRSAGIPVRGLLIAAAVFIGLLVIGWIAIFTGALPIVPA